jgi:hypothetical protein
MPATGFHRLDNHLAVLILELICGQIDDIHIVKDEPSMRLVVTLSPSILNPIRVNTAMIDQVISEHE